jgi:hypothetical protein
MCYHSSMTFELFHISFGSQKACAMAYDQERKYCMLFFDLNQKIKSGEQWVIPKALQPGAKFELTPDEIERAKTA